MHTTKFNKSRFSIPPEAFNLIDVGLIFNELIFSVFDPKVFSIPDIDKAIIASQAIGEVDSIHVDLYPNYLLQLGLRAIWDYLGVGTSIAFEDTKDNDFHVCSASFLVFDKRSAKEGSVYFNFPAKGGFRLTEISQMRTNGFDITVDNVASQPNQTGDLRCSKVYRKQAH